MTAQEVLPKARRYCALQERCHQEVRDKLYSWGSHQEEVEQVIGQLIGEGYLNEQRFAEHYAVSKFRQKGWGRVKIRESLKFKKVSAPCIKNGLAAIDDGEYSAYLANAVKKLRTKTKGRNEWEGEQRVKRYLMGRGFESEAIDDALKTT
ncbi:MAG: RecX family transcriptional regulator [Flavobacteriales bacterium]|nr:RecX family transcriptional regulator [Flavobacteriales bacterium]